MTFFGCAVRLAEDNARVRWCARGWNILEIRSHERGLASRSAPTRRELKGDGERRRDRASDRDTERCGFEPEKIKLGRKSKQRRREERTRGEIRREKETGQKNRAVSEENRGEVAGVGSRKQKSVVKEAAGSRAGDYSRSVDKPARPGGRGIHSRERRRKICKVPNLIHF